MSAVEDVATAIAETVRAKGWPSLVDEDEVLIFTSPWEEMRLICTLVCKDASQAKRLAAMMQQPPEPVRGVFDAMGIDPVDPLFPSIGGRA